MSLWQSVILGFIQGVTEFLPVSSSGHLVLMKHYLDPGLTSDISFDVVVHGGTLMAILIVYRKKIWDLLRYLFTEAPGRLCKEGFIPTAWRDERGRLITLILVGSIPTAILGFSFQDLFENLFTNIVAVIIALAITGTLLYSTRLIPESHRGKKELNWGSALLVGVIQGLAITPGISRSGSTISTGMWTGVGRCKAADYSFLLSIPAILGAFLLKIKDMVAGSGHEFPSLAVGFVVSFVSGYVALRILLRFVRRGQLHLFAWYCWGVAAVSLLGILL